MLFSFVLPAYKAAYFKEAIKSILAQTYSDFELVIVNDASPEDLDSIVKGFDDGRIRYYVNEENIGGKDLVAQWNHSISYAEGEYLILASDDDMYHPEFLETFVPLISRYPEANVFRPRVRHVDENGQVIETERNVMGGGCSLIKFCYLSESKMLFGGIPYYIFKKSVLMEMGGFINFPAAWYSDGATVIAACGNQIVCSEKVLFSFRKSDVSLSFMKPDENLMMKKINAALKFRQWMLERCDRMCPADDIEKSELEAVRQLVRENEKTMIIQVCASSGILQVIRHHGFLRKECGIPIGRLLRLYCFMLAKKPFLQLLQWA